jgi:dipeptidyl aminopeptidase/acylaminoacyl peptidase
MQRFNDQSLDALGATTLFNDSPDGKYSVVLTSKGLIDSDKIQSTLWLVDYQSLRIAFQSPRVILPPRLSAIVSIAASPTGTAHGTGSYGSVISGVRWSSDSGLIYFLGENSRGNRQLYKVPIHSHDAQPLTSEEGDVESFDIAGNVILYRASMPASLESKTTLRASSQRTMLVATGMPLVDILAVPDSDRLRNYDLWCLRNGRSRRVLKVPSQEQDVSYSLAQPLAISPNARFAILPLTPKSIPLSWERYEAPPQFDFLRLNHLDLRPISPYNVTNPLREYALVDLTKNSTIPLGLDAFYLNSLGVRSAQWSRDSQHVLISNIFLPLEQSDPEASNRIHPCEAAVFDVVSNTSECLTFGGSIGSAPSGAHLQRASLKSDGTEASLDYGSFGSTDASTEIFRYANHEWKLVQSSSSQAAEKTEYRKSAILLYIKESLNERPTLWAKDSTTGSQMKIWDPNPDFEHLELGRASDYHWTDRLGRSWSGGLFLPLGYTKGHRYPLVIQTHGFSPSKFIVDGSYPTAMAARALESAGIMVLQVFGTGGDPSHLSTNDEAVDAVQGFESAIDALDAATMIDPNRVGIVGFSRTCWYVENALVNMPGRFAAATVADGVSYSYTQYLFFGPSSTLMERNYLQVIGTPPIGDGINQWIRYAPEFHTERISTPLRIEAIQSHSVLEEWELYASLKLQGKPVDLIYFPRGQHILQRPSERLASEQGNVDWFRFWLQEYEDPNPLKRDQYERWRMMRESLGRSRRDGDWRTINSRP